MRRSAGERASASAHAHVGERGDDEHEKFSLRGAKVRLTPQRRA